MVSLVEKVQKELSYPQEIESLFGCSLNVLMKDTAYFIVTTILYDHKINKDFERLYPAQFHMIG